MNSIVVLIEHSHTISPIHPRAAYGDWYWPKLTLSPLWGGGGGDILAIL